MGLASLWSPGWLLGGPSRGGAGRLGQGWGPTRSCPHPRFPGFMDEFTVTRHTPPRLLCATLGVGRRWERQDSPASWWAESLVLVLGEISLVATRGRPPTAVGSGGAGLELGHRAGLYLSRIAGHPQSPGWGLVSPGLALRHLSGRSRGVGPGTPFVSFKVRAWGFSCYSQTLLYPGTWEPLGAPGCTGPAGKGHQSPKLCDSL